MQAPPLDVRLRLERRAGAVELLLEPLAGAAGLGARAEGAQDAGDGIAEEGGVGPVPEPAPGVRAVAREKFSFISICTLSPAARKDSTTICALFTWLV
jgi:hypothetical protein